MEKEKCLALIELYKFKELFRNPKCANYHNKSIRENVRKDIDDEMKMPVQELKKITPLLTSYKREKF
jgi:hypothetical protein